MRATLPRACKEPPCCMKPIPSRTGRGDRCDTRSGGWTRRGSGEQSRVQRGNRTEMMEESSAIRGRFLSFPSQKRGNYSGGGEYGARRTHILCGRTWEGRGRGKRGGGAQRQRPWPAWPISTDFLADLVEHKPPVTPARPRARSPGAAQYHRASKIIRSRPPRETSIP